MKLFSILISLLFTTTPLLHKTEQPIASDQIKVYIFLHESCRVSQFYTPTLKELHSNYSSESLEFEGIFPYPKTKKEDIKAFQDKYDLPFDMIIDYNQTITKKMGATITPEAIVYNTTKDEIIYRGRIDDSYFRVGKRRQVTTTSELKDVLEALQNCDPVEVKSQKAIGCFIKIL